MEKLLRTKKIFHLAFVISAAIGPVAIAEIIFFILKLLYVPMAICIALTAHAFYGAPLYYFAERDLEICERMVRTVSEENTLDITLIAERVGVKPPLAERLLAKCVKNQYIETKTE